MRLETRALMNKSTSSQVKKPTRIPYSFTPYLMPQNRGRKSSHLPGCLILYKLLEDPVGLGGQLGFRPGLFEVLTRQPKVKVLLAELCLQEGVEGGHPVWGGEREQLMGQNGGRKRRMAAGKRPPGSSDLGICRFPFPPGKFHPLRHY